MMISLTGGVSLRLASSFLVFLAGTWICTAAASAGNGAGERNFCVDYSPEPDTNALLAYDMAILSEKAEVDMSIGQELGRRYLGYISLVEVADAEHQQAASKAGLLTKAVNPVWKGAVADVTRPEWKAFVLEQLAKPIASRGFDGFFLDTADSVALIAE